MNRPLKFLVDVSVGQAVQDSLKATGYDSVAVRDIDPRMSDKDILELAVREQRLVITQDKDFGELVYLSGQAHTGVLLLRLDDATGAEKVRVVEEILNQYESQLPGQFAVYQNGRLRTR